MSTYKKITAARRLLGLPEQATLQEIKTQYRQRIKQVHPDRSPEDAARGAEKTAELIAAYKILLAYCNQYKFSFSKEEVQNYLSKEEWWLERFGCDPLWGKSEH